MIEYKRTKAIEADKLKELFLSVNWFSGNFPEKLRTAFINSSKVITAWDNDKLVGLIRGLDDGIWQATIDCLLVNPDYQGRGIASTLLKMMLGDYETLLYVDVLPEQHNASFYLKHGFQITEERTPLQISSQTWT
ncbi:MAG: GNAT family N-acetyltransferase [Oscillospiraceae bacterium]|nr:GNAT family N-acetyltransferase [Oscillospiraceae bacterium]